MATGAQSRAHQGTAHPLPLTGRKAAPRHRRVWRRALLFYCILWWMHLLHVSTRVAHVRGPPGRCSLRVHGSRVAVIDTLPCGIDAPAGQWGRRCEEPKRWRGARQPTPVRVILGLIEFHRAGFPLRSARGAVAEHAEVEGAASGGVAGWRHAAGENDGGVKGGGEELEQAVTVVRGWCILFGCGGGPVSAVSRAENAESHILRHRCYDLHSSTASIDAPTLTWASTAAALACQTCAHGSPCCTHAALMLRSCCAHAAPMLRPCCAHAALMLRPCCAHDAPMLRAVTPSAGVLRKGVRILCRTCLRVKCDVTPRTACSKRSRLKHRILG